MSTGKSTTRGQHRFSQVPTTNVPRSSFNRSQGYKTTFDAGYLIPVFCDEALPGDTFNLSMTAFARLATPLHPFMDNMWLDVFFFFIPNRLVWDNWQAFMGEKDDPEDETEYQIPQSDVPAGGWEHGSLQDYFGIPPQVDNIKHSVLPLRGYTLVYNEWFRDENLIASRQVNKGDGPDASGAHFLARRGKRHDYMTSCLPWPQKGPSVILGLGGQAPVELDSPQWHQVVGAVNDVPTWQFTEVIPTGDHTLRAEPNGNAEWIPNPPTSNLDAHWDDPGLRTDLGGATGIADLTQATASTVNALRAGFQLQKLLERDARGGTRYTEIIRSHFGVVSPDARLQRPEYLGGGTMPLVVNPVPQTSASDVNSPQANLAAYGIAARGGIGFTKSFSEHGYVLGLVSARADLNYQQGLERHWNRETRYDYFWPVFSGLGEQAVKNREIFAQGTTEDDDTFGYQERYAEYRYKPSLITGLFRSSHPQSLDVWHLAQDFQNLPVLGEQFIHENPPVTRVIAVQTEPHFLLDAFFSYRCARPMPLFGVPGLIDHF